MKKYDVLVIGGGLLGCFSARSLCRRSLRCAVLESREDVCCGMSRANAAVVYPGYDGKPGSLKSSLSLRANAGFETLCAELDVPFRRCGSLLTANGPGGKALIQKKYDHGIQTGVPGLRILNAEELRELEPALSSTVTTALYAPSAGTVMPWELCIAAYENACRNGAEFFFRSPVFAIARADGGYVVSAGQEEFFCRAVINCAGSEACRVRDLLFEPEYGIFPDYSDFLVLGRDVPGTPSHIVMQETEHGKGICAVPTLPGNLLLESAPRAFGCGTETDRLGLLQLIRDAGELFPALRQVSPLRSFASARPIVRHLARSGSTYLPDGQKVGSFVIDRPEPRFFSLIGIKTPGLTCAHELTRQVADELADTLGSPTDPAFDPVRTAPPRLRDLPPEQAAALIAADPDYGRIVCRCETVSLAEIRVAIEHGASTVDGVKFRTGAMMGCCQGSSCQQQILELLARQTGRDIRTIQKGAEGSRILYGDSHGTC